MTDRWTTETEEPVTAVLLAHEDYVAAGEIRCTCGWSIKGAPIGALAAAKAYMAHKSAAILTALADAGVLLPPGGDTVVHRDYPGSDCRRHPFGEHTHRRTVTSWPDGSQHFGPWREVTNDPA